MTISVTKTVLPSFNLAVDSVNTDGTIWKQYLAALLSSVISLGTGCVGGWSSPATPKLLNGTSDLGLDPITVEQASWVGSLINVGAFAGAIPAGYLSFRFGRKASLLFLAWPIIIGWILILFNQNNIWILYLGRFISGLSYGSMNIVLPIYNNEICCDKIRGRVGTIYDLLQCIGLLYIFWFGATTSLYWATIYCLCVPIFFLFTFIWMPESPLYLIRKGQQEKAIQSIKWLYGSDTDLDYHLRRIKNALMEGTEQPHCSNVSNDEVKRSPNSIIDKARKFIALDKITIKAVSLAFFLFLIQRTCGPTLLTYYGDTIFQQSQSSIPFNYATVVNGLIAVVGSVASIVAIDTLGRRALLTISFLVQSISIGLFTLYVYLIVVQRSEFWLSLPIKEYYGLIPVITLCVFTAMFRLGVSPVPWFMAAEIIPIEAQKWAPSVIVCFTWTCSFLLSKNFLPALQFFGQVPVYLFFSVVCIIGTFYTYMFIPETKNKSREQIQRELGVNIRDNHNENIC